MKLLHHIKEAHAFFLRESVSFAGEHPSFRPHYLKAYFRFIRYSVADYFRGRYNQ